MYRKLQKLLRTNKNPRKFEDSKDHGDVMTINHKN